MENLIIYPSKTSQFLYIDTVCEIGMDDISVFNFSGSKMDNYMVKIEDNRIEFNVCNLPKGLYFIIIIERKAGVIKRGKFCVTK